jgi:bla regulator protein BlaR1
MTFLLSASLRVGVILLISLVLLRVLRGRSAALRHWILSAAVFSSVAVPVLTFVVPRQNIDVVVSEMPAYFPILEEPAASTPFPQGRSNPSAPAEEASLAEPPAQSPPTVASAPAQEASTRFWTLPRALWTVWGVGFLGVLLGIAVGAGQLFWIARKSQPLISDKWTRIAAEAAARYDLRRKVTLLQSDRLPVLATWGARRPRLLVPADAAQWPEERIRVAVYHEFAHIQRQDWLVQMIAELQRSLYWFNPLAWIVCKRLAQEREQASDDQALNSGIDAPEYANELLSLARGLHQPGRLWLAAAPMARPSTIERRFDAMLNPHLNRKRVGRLVGAATITVCLLLTLPLTVLRLNAIAATAAAVVQSVIPLSPATLAQATTPASPVQADVAAAPSSPSSLEGIVLDRTTDRPIAGVTVALPDVPGTRVSVRSDSDGRFVIPGIEAGTYRITTNKEGYTDAQPEVRKNPTRNNRGGVWYTVNSGQQLKDIVIRLNPGSVVTGRVVDANGDPVEEASVSLVRKAFNNKGELYNASFGDRDSNDRGEYRIFDVEPGEYFVRLDSGPLANEPGIYYPGTQDFSRARSITVLPGKETRLDTLVMQSGTPAAKRVPIHVRVINETGEAPGGVWFTHWGLKGTYGLSITSSAKRFGGPDKWELDGGLPPGPHDISLGWTTPMGRAFGQKTIQVGTEEMTVDLPIRMGVRVNLRAVVESPNGATQPLAGLRVSFTGNPPSINFNPSSTPRTVTGEDGLLSLPNVPEIPYAVSFYGLSGLPPDLYLIRARQGNRDLLRELAEVAGETLIEVTVGSGGGTIEGVATDAAGKKISGAQVAVVPESSLRDMPHLYKTVSTDQQGRFALRGIAPGTYKIFALSEDYGDLPYLNDDFMKGIEDKGREIKISRGQKLAAEVRIADEEL